MLMQEVRGANRRPSKLRRSQNWIGGSRPGNAVFVPPPPKQVVELLIALLLNDGILSEIGARKRDRIYRYKRYLSLLE
tara:strand:+ start:6060 stop:6293 length:234 start_codon:yes stop_codon:yes gene_type:complete